MSRPSLRLGVLCHGPTLQAWQARSLERLMGSGDVDLALVIEADRPDDGRSASSRTGGAWITYRNRWLADRSRALRAVDASEIFARVPSIRLTDVSRIRSERLDVILSFVPHVPSDLLDVARYGVWAFRHGDLDAGPTDPPGFWEVLRGEPVTSAALVRVADGAAAGTVLHRGAFRTHGWSYVRNLDAMYLGSAEWPAQVCTAIRNRGRVVPDDVTTFPRLTRRIPGGLDLLKLAAAALGRIAIMQMRSLFSIEQWNVGVVDAPIHRFLDGSWPAPARWLPQPDRHRFVADPFGIRRDGRMDVVMEEWDHRRRNARIVAVESGGDGEFSEPRTVMDPSFHVSYPFLLEWEGELYCIPETGRLNRVDLYRCTKFPGGWVRVGSLIESFPAQDPTVFRHDGRWWLMCGSRRLASTELHAWHADDLLGPWRPHPGNPLKTDIRSSRPGGTPFVHDGQLYRPAQDGSRTYGGAMAINRVQRLTPTEFEEELVTVIQPDRRGPYRGGVHTMSAVGDVTLIDAKRAVFVWAAFRHRLGARLRDLGGRDGGRSERPVVEVEAAP